MAPSDRGASEGHGSRPIDPVCGMFPHWNTPHRLAHEGKTLLFCSSGCQGKFEADPGRYLHPLVNGGGHHGHGTPSLGAAAPPATRWTCPMHPEIVRDVPGSCPICGMALEPITPTLDDAPNPELAEMSGRFLIGLALTIPVLLLEMGAHVLGFDLVPPRLSPWWQFAFATPVVIWAGWPFFARAAESIRNRSLNMFSLIALGTGAAWVYSVVATVAPQIFPPAFQTEHGTVAVYFEASAVIIVLVLLGQVLELRAREASGDAIRALLGLAPKTARRVREGGEEEVPLDAVQVGDTLRVRPGEKTPVDGVVIDGRSALDESLITGESMPVTRGPGDAVIGGCLNQTGALLIEARAVGRDTMLSQIVTMVAEAQRSRAPIQRLADQVSAWFVPTVIGAALTAFVVWLAVGPEPAFSFGLISAVSVLIIACPCALGLATPMSIMAGIGRGAQMGVLIKSAEALERLETVNTLVLDKTGTLTEGRPAIVGLAIAPDQNEAEVLRLAASVESRSEHPLAQAVTAEARRRGLTMSEPTTFDSPPGKGVEGIVEGRRVLIGQDRFLRERGISADGLASAADAFRADGATAILVALDDRLAGVIGIADPLKETAASALAALREGGLRLVMLTGDNHKTAEAVARALAIDAFEAEVLPEDKAKVVARLMREGRVVAMAGDGVNDAPALAAADVGIAMGTGTDVAIESAGITLLRGDLTGIVRARSLSRATMRNIRQNLFFAFAYNAAGIPIAAGALYPITGDLLSPVIAAAAMALSSVSVIVNALRLRSVRVDGERMPTP